MQIGSALSGSRPGVESVCGAQGEKRNAADHTGSPSLETARDTAKHSESSDLPGIMTQLNALDSSEELLGRVF